MSAAQLETWFVVCGGGALALAVVAWVFDRCLGARRPRLAALAWWAVLARLVLPPWIASPLGWSAVLKATGARADVGTDLGVDVAAPSFASVGVEPVGVELVGVELVLSVWIAGALVLAAVLAWRLAREARHWSQLATRAPQPNTVAALERAARALDLGRVPRLAVTAIDGPACIGLVRPWIALPARFESAGCTRGELEGALLHELAHLRRRDAWRGLVATACACAVWFHPVGWLAVRRLAALAEFDCDGAAARRQVGGAAAYRRALLGEVARRVGLARGGGPLAPGLLHPRSAAIARLRALERAASGPLVRAEGSVAAFALLLALACSGPRALEREAAPDPRRFVEALPDAPLDELPGCLNTRYAVMAHTAAARAATPDSSSPSLSTLPLER